ncbi:DUF5818 domain-containing protein [Alteriqipengyuania sp. 357]
MGERKFTAILITALMTIAACAGDPETPEATQNGASEGAGDETAAAAGTRPAGEPDLVSVEGRIEDGVECPVLRTPDGKTYALSFRETDIGPGDYVRLRGEIADASFCMQGEGTLIVQDASRADPPARAGGLAETSQ